MKILLLLFALPLLAQVPAVNSGTATYPSSGTICTTASCPGTVTSVVMAGTANQILVSGTCTVTGSGTCTFSLPNGVILGTDNVSAGTIQLANGSANAHTIWGSGATTTNTIQGFAVVPTTGHLLDCTVSSTTCLLHDSGVVTANAVVASSPGAGVAHFAGSTQTVTSSPVVNADVTSIDAATKLTGITPSANGGTASAFFTVSGPASSAKTFTFPNANATISYTIATGAKALATGAISSAACTTAQTDTATGTLTTDVISATFNGDPTGVTGYVPLSSGMLTIIVYPTADTVNFKVCNNTNASITPGAITLNWRVAR